MATEDTSGSVTPPYEGRQSEANAGTTSDTGPGESATGPAHTPGTAKGEDQA